MKKTAFPALPAVLSAVLFLVSSQAFVAAAEPAEADTSSEAEAAWSGGWELSAGDNYIWRGIPCYENLVLLPDVWLTYREFTLELWSGQTTSEKDVSPRRQELDYILTHEFELKGLTIRNALYYYHYIHQSGAPSTGEWIGTIEYPAGPFTLSASVAADLVEYRGAVYMEQAVSFEKEIRPPVSLSTALRIGTGFSRYNDAYAGVPATAADFASWEGRLTWSMDNGLYVQPYVLFSKTLDDRLTEAFNGHNTGFGLTIGKEY
jgi:hypothetical protein